MQRQAVGLREYIERIIAERDRQYGQRFQAQERAVAKAEEAQRAYNERSNEFRGQLDDQAKTLMPRAETALLFQTVDKQMEMLRGEIQGLRESRSTIAGASSTTREYLGYGIAVIAIIAAAIISLLK